MMSVSTVPKDSQTRTVEILQKESLSEDPIFQNIKVRALNWLKAPLLPLGAEMDSVYFGTDRFELIVDTRGYRPEDVRCTVGSNSVQVLAERHEMISGSHRTMQTSRSYQLPQLISPQQAICCLSSEGILMVAVPWQKF